MLTVVIPALNEAGAIRATIEDIRASLSAAGIVHEIIVINDGSTDGTGEIARAAGAHVIDHPAPGGYGRALKDGILASRYEWIAITDADGTYPNARIPDLYRLATERGFDMVVGARTGPEYRGSLFKMPARRVFLWLSEYATGSKIDDINSGLRVFRREIVLRFIGTISNGFSFTTTITLAAMLNGYFVKYEPIEYFKRVGSSHVRYIRDTLRSLQIIIENILFYNPLKLFLLVSNVLFAMSAVAFLFGCVIPVGSRFLPIAQVLAPLSLVAAFLVGAIGLAANLVRQAVASGERRPMLPWGANERRDVAVRSEPARESSASATANAPEAE